MRICLISGSFPDMQCGVGDYTANLATALVGGEVEVWVLTSCHPEIHKGKKNYVTDGLRVLDAVGRWNSHSLSLVKRIVGAIKPDLVHIQYQTGTFERRPWVSFLPISLRNCRTVVTFHDTHYPNLLPKMPKSIRKYFLLPLLLFTDSAVVSNEEDGQMLKSIYPKVEIRSIPVGPSVQYDSKMRFTPAKVRQKIGIKPGDFLISCYGFVSDERDNHLLLGATKALKSRGIPAKLVYIGGFDRSKENFETYRTLLARVTKSGLAGDVIFTGYLEAGDVSKVLRVSDVHVYARKTGISFARTTLITALSHGIPIVATGDGNHPEDFVDHENIVIVPQGDTDRLVSAIQEILFSPRLRHRLSESGLRLSQKFSWKRIAKQHLDIYECVVGRARNVI